VPLLSAISACHLLTLPTSISAPIRYALCPLHYAEFIPLPHACRGIVPPYRTTTGPTSDFCNLSFPSSQLRSLFLPPSAFPLPASVLCPSRYAPCSLRSTIFSHFRIPTSNFSPSHLRFPTSDFCPPSSVLWLYRYRRHHLG
jgi:hypothetical protein